MINMKKVAFISTLLLSMIMISCGDDDPFEDFNNGNEPTEERQYVDLGLPSGTLWATMNIGANKPEDCGYYFAWGETSPKQNYDWSTYKWCKGEFDKLTKYCTNSNYGTVDNKTELEPKDDAAYVNWGKSWRTPSIAQIEELRSGCTVQLYTMNGVKGYLFISKRNSNSIFLPLDGYLLRGSPYYADSGCYYWSSTLLSGNSQGAYCLYINTNFDGWSNSRNYGQCIRPVRVSKN